MFSYDSYPSDPENKVKERVPEELSLLDMNSANENCEKINKAGVTFPIGEIWNALETDKKQTLPKDINITYYYNFESHQ